MAHVYGLVPPEAVKVCVIGGVPEFGIVRVDGETVIVAATDDRMVTVAAPVLPYASVAVTVKVCVPCAAVGKVVTVSTPDVKFIEDPL